MTHQLTTLPNGIRVLTLPRADAESVRVAIYARVGARNEWEAVNGASHFIEHMLFKGTERRSAKALSQAIEGQGGSLNAYTDRDHTCYYAKVPHDKAAIALDVLTDLFYHATFDPKELDRERQVICEEIRMYDDQPDSVAVDRLVAQVWSGHPLGRPILGTLEGIQSMPREALLSYWRGQYAPSRTLFAFVGRIDPARCVADVERLTRHLTPAAQLREPEPFSRAIPLDPLCVERRAGIQQAQLALGWRTGPWQAVENPPALAALSCLLGETMMGRLFQSIREKRGLCYNISSGVSQMTDCGLLAITAGCAPDKALTCARAILAECRRVAFKPLSAAELRRTRDYLCGRFRLRLDEAPLWFVASRTLFGLPVDPAAKLAQLRAITAEEIRACAEQVFSPGNLALTAILPEGTRSPAAAWARLID